MTPATQLDGLETKLRQLAAKVDRQQAQYEAVVSEKEQLQRELDQQRTVAATAPTTPSPSSKSTVAATPADTAAHRETIAYCLSEIDRCLEWLHRN